MLHFIDISNWQKDLECVLALQIDACVMKATEGNYFVDKYCDRWAQQCIEGKKPFGFYHFANDGDPYVEADFFIDNCEGYFGKGIPILDWEGYNGINQTVNWVNLFVRRVHERAGIWPWIYANPWRFNQGGVEQNCGRWVAAYPSVNNPSFEWAENHLHEMPETDGLVCAWQFASDGQLEGYDRNLDVNLYFGDVESWYKYANPNSEPNPEPKPEPKPEPEKHTFEDDKYKVTIEEKDS